jgi:hypothetical protein
VRDQTNETEQSPSEGVKISSFAHAHRVYLRWRGYSPVDEAFINDDKRQIGWIDLYCILGSIDLPDTAGPSLSGFKGGALPKSPPTSHCLWARSKAYFLKAL